MEEYHKINAPFKRNNDGDKKLVIGDWALEEFEFLQNNRWEFTEKVDGTNIRVNIKLTFDDNVYVKFGGRTDNAQIPPHLAETLEAMFGYDTDRLRMFRHMMLERDIRDLVLHGEGYGPKIQGGGKYREDASFVLFDIKIGDTWLKRNAVNDIGDKLDVDTVPVIGYGSINDAINIVKFGLGYDDPYLISQWGNFEAEGIVARPAVPLFDRQGKRIITKVKARDFR